VEWKSISATQFVLKDDKGVYQRQVVIRDPRMNEPDGLKYVVSGEGHDGPHIFDSLDEALAAAKASL
jgi:hypothetical protein